MPATGKITQVIGSTFDAEFPEDQLPSIYNAITVDLGSTGDGAATVGRTPAGSDGGGGAGAGGDGSGRAEQSRGGVRLTGEVASHLGGGKIRAVALGST